jgi:hypothetical protein
MRWVQRPRRAPARIFEETPAIEIDPHGVRKRIVTPTARARLHVVLAGNVHIRRVMPGIATRCCRLDLCHHHGAAGRAAAQIIGYAGAVSTLNSPTIIIESSTAITDVVGRAPNASAIPSAMPGSLWRISVAYPQLGDGGQYA